MNDKKLIFLFDLDGTLIETGHEINPKLIEMLTPLIHQNLVLIVTARHPWGVRFIFQKYFDFIPTISLNGAGFHLKSWDLFDKTYFIPTRLVYKLHSYLEKIDAVINYYGPDFWAVTKINSSVNREALVTGMKPIRIEGYHFSQVLKILIIIEVEEHYQIRTNLQEKFGQSLLISSSHRNYIELSAQNVQKCMHTPLFLKYYHHNSTKLNILFIGDSENDIPCIDYATSVWTYSHAPLPLKKAASGILQEGNGLGVLNLLQELKLQGLLF